MDPVKKVYPTTEELCKVITSSRCTEDGCSSVFTSESMLTLHLVKTHKKAHLMAKADDAKRAFHCPETSCVYHDSLYFKNLKLLKQHYLKVHGEKSFFCESCSTGFPTLAAKKSHAEYCGVSFKCCDCDTSYPCYESLKTHSRRKKHTILNKAEYKPKVFVLPVNNLEASSSDTTFLKKEVFILPKASCSSQTLLAPGKFPMLEKSSQTEMVLPKLKTKRTQVSRDVSGKCNSQHTQTAKLKACVETQTIGDYFSKKSTMELSDLNEENLRKSTRTQTKPVQAFTKSCNTSFSDVLQEVLQTNSSTQTSISPTEFLYSTTTTSTHDTTPTETGDLAFDLIGGPNLKPNLTDDSFGISFFNCNSETQTDLFGDDLFNYCDFYSNMCTQTCEDILLDSLAFNDTQTQTVLDDMLRSVESQTNMSHGGRKQFLSCRDMAHMETQTENEFKQMLEEINA